jgi:chromatin segregation and condensation protein Rec8/ScpA/Scc1 (kleisin family)
LAAVRVAELELDLDVFAGPFDLLLTLVLREEVDLLEVDLADVVLAYLDHLESRDELDLEVATEFLVLISALLELKSRLMLPRADEEGLGELDPDEAAEELLARMLAHLRSLLRRGSFGFDEAVRGADRVTVAMTLFALLELHKRGEATWRQAQPFGEISVSPPQEAGAAGRASA